MDIKKALVYPYKQGNFWLSVGIPTLLYVGITAWMMLAIFVPLFIAAMCGIISKSEPSGPAVLLMVIVMVVALVPMLPVCFWLYGYYWALVDHWQNHGLEAPPPEWKGHWKQYLAEGFHAFLALIIMYIPMLFALLSLGFLMPFVVTPFLTSAQDRSLGGFFKNFGAAMALAKARYWQILGALWVSVLLVIPFYLVCAVTSITFVAPLLVGMAFTVSITWLLIEQAYPALSVSSGEGPDSPN